MPGPFDMAGMQREAADNVAALEDQSRKTAAYNALNKVYGPTIAYDPTAAHNASVADVSRRTADTQVSQEQENLRKTQLENTGTAEDRQRMATYRAAQLLLSQADPQTGAITPEAYDKVVRPNAKLFGIDDEHVQPLHDLLTQPGGAAYLQHVQQAMIGPTKVTGAVSYGVDAQGNPVAITKDQYGNIRQQQLGGTQTTGQQNADTAKINAGTKQGMLGVAQQNARTGAFRANTTANNSVAGNPDGMLGQGGGGGAAAPSPGAQPAPGKTTAAAPSVIDRLPLKGRQQAISQADQIVNSGTQLATTNKILDTVMSQVNPYTAGTGSMLKDLPGSAQADLKANLKTLSAQGLTAWINSLKNGQGQTGIGRVLQSEANAAMTLFGNMEQDQSAKQLAFHAQLFRQTVNKLYQHQQQAFKTVYKQAPHEALGVDDPMTAPAPESKGGFREGVTYTDANGNSAAYRGGKFVPVK